jgi:hypothetical protein
MVRCTWDRTDDQAAEQTAHPTAVRAGGRVFNSNRCTQIDEEPVFGRSSEVSSHRIRHTGPGVTSERVTYREEQRGINGAPDNRSMAGRIQHGEVRIQKKGI